MTTTREQKQDLESMITRALPEIAKVKKKVYGDLPKSEEQAKAIKFITNVEDYLQGIRNLYIKVKDNPKLLTWSTVQLAIFAKEVYTLRNQASQIYNRQYHLFLAVKKQLPVIVDNILKSGFSTSQKSIFLTAINNELDQIKKQLFHSIESCDDKQISNDKCLDLIKSEVSQLPLNVPVDVDVPGKPATSIEIAQTIRWELAIAMFPYPDKAVNFAILHPMMFDFYETLIELSNAAPKTLDGLLPLPSFMPDNFSCSSEDGGVIARYAKYVSGITFDFKHINNQSFMYELTQHKTGKAAWKGVFDFSQVYSDALIRFVEQIENEEKNFLTHCSQSPQAKSIVASLDLLDKFKKNTSEFITRSFDKNKYSVVFHSEYKDCYWEEKIGEIKKLIKENNETQSVFLEMEIMLDNTNPQLMVQLIGKFNIQPVTPDANLDASSSLVRRKYETTAASIKASLLDKLESLSTIKHELERKLIRLEMIKAFPECVRKDFYNFLNGNDFLEMTARLRGVLNDYSTYDSVQSIALFKQFYPGEDETTESLKKFNEELVAPFIKGELAKFERAPAIPVSKILAQHGTFPSRESKEIPVANTQGAPFKLSLSQGGSD